MTMLKLRYRCEECSRSFSVTRREDDVTDHETCTRCMHLADIDLDHIPVSVDGYGTPIHTHDPNERNA